MLTDAPLLLALLLALPQAVESPRVELSPGPAARTHGLIGPGLAPASVRASPSPDPGTWKDDGPWLAWARAVRTAAEGGEGAEAAHVQLALIALSQGRSEDAWDRFAALSGHPALAQALLPAFLPGVPLEGVLPALDAPLPDGVLLAPALPPPSVPAHELLRGMGRLELREMTLEGLRVGEARLKLRVKMQPDGIEVELAHLSGARASVHLRVPVPVDFRADRTYLDWEEVGAPGPVEVVLEPGAEPRVVFVRVRQRALTWGITLPPELPVGVREQGLLVLAPEEEQARARGLAAALAALLELPATASAQPPAPARPAWTGVLVDLRGPDERKLAGLMSLAEHHALSHARAPR